MDNIKTFYSAIGFTKNWFKYLRMFSNKMLMNFVLFEDISIINSNLFYSKILFCCGGSKYFF